MPIGQDLHGFQVPKHCRVSYPPAVVGATQNKNDVMPLCGPYLDVSSRDIKQSAQS